MLKVITGVPEYIQRMIRWVANILGKWLLLCLLHTDCV